MKIPRGTWLSCAALVFLAGLLSNSADLLFVSAVAVSAGLGGEVVASLRSRREQGPHQRALHDLEERLLLTEGALASAIQQISHLKEERNDDTQVRLPGGTTD